MEVTIFCPGETLVYNRLEMFTTKEIKSTYPSYIVSRLIHGVTNNHPLLCYEMLNMLTFRNFVGCIKELSLNNLELKWIQDLLNLEHWISMFKMTITSNFTKTNMNKSLTKIQIIFPYSAHVGRCPPHNPQLSSECEKKGNCGEAEKKGNCGEAEKKGNCGEGEKKGNCEEGEKKGNCGEAEIRVPAESGKICGGLRLGETEIDSIENMSSPHPPDISSSSHSSSSISIQNDSVSVVKGNLGQALPQHCYQFVYKCFYESLPGAKSGAVNNKYFDFTFVKEKYARRDQIEDVVNQFITKYRNKIYNEGLTDIIWTINKVDSLFYPVNGAPSGKRKLEDEDDC